MPWWNSRDENKRVPPRKGRRNSVKHTAAIIAANSGKHSPERCEINRQAHLGLPQPLKGKTVLEIFGEKRAPAMLERCRNAARIRGEMLQGKTEIEIYGQEKAAEIAINRSKGRRAATEATKDQNARDDYRYLEWRDAVRGRDSFTCQHCNKKCVDKRQLHAHHIKSWDSFPELRYDIINGVSLCNSCHRKEHHRRRIAALTELLSLLEQNDSIEIQKAIIEVRGAFDLFNGTARLK